MPIRDFSFLILCNICLCYRDFTMEEERLEKLRMAFLKRDVELIKKLLINRSACPHVALYWAVKMSVDDDENMNNSGNAPDKGAITAVENRNKELIRFILDRGANVNAKIDENCFDYSTFAYACRYASVDIIKMLETPSYYPLADFGVEDRFGRFPIQLAFRSGQDDKIDLFLDKSKWSPEGNIYKKGLNHTFGRNFVNRLNLLYYAVASNIVQEETIMKLIKLGANVNNKTNDGSTNLESAISAGNLEIVKILLNKGANIHQGREYPLTAAAKEGYQDIVKFLLDNGANVNGRESDTIDPVQSAALGGCEKTVEFLLKQGAQVGNALKCAIEKGHAKVVKLLLNRGVDANCTIGSKTALAYAMMYTFVRNKSARIVKLLLDHGSRVNDAGP